MKWIFLFGFLLISITVSAQEAFVATGDDLTTGFGTVNYSVGQLVVKSDSTKHGSMRHGVQIPIELFKIPVGIHEITEIQAEAFPNPTFDHVKIMIPNTYRGPFSIKIMDIHGRILDNYQMTTAEMLLSLSHYSSGTYSIVIAQQTNIVSSFSIIKQ
ncbi:MAG: T9SS type A sorting domain-containing protein [Ignavibacteria bacterium]